MWHHNLVGGVQLRAATRTLVFEKAMRLRDMYVQPFGGWACE